MATDDVVTLPVSGENGTRSIQLPDGWLTSAEVSARRFGERVVLEPIAPPAPAAGDEHRGWPPGYWEWLDTARARGEFDSGEVEPFEVRFQDPDDL